MKYQVSYSCVSHIGNCRGINQDNFICVGKYLNHNAEPVTPPVMGCIMAGHPAVLGIFDGMGGEECGEVASLLAAKEAMNLSVTKEPIQDLLSFCESANKRICQYAEENGITSMGTTAALLAFAEREIGLCNIGDSKIFRFADKKLVQISIDHVAVAVYGKKPPLSQNLGIPPEEMRIEPYVALGRYKDGDEYLICSDGLTDMVSQEEIAGILCEEEFDMAAEKLLEKALAGGGKDNITIILCRVERVRKGLLQRVCDFYSKE